VTTDVGPRIIRFDLRVRKNEFKEYDDTAGKQGGDEWRIYGGTASGTPPRPSRARITRQLAGGPEATR
jgi:hypothetical protein